MMLKEIEVLTAVNVKIAVFCNMTPFSLVGMCQRGGAVCYEMEEAGSSESLVPVC
jgi:hypothetical protein